jgi:hypothetical protein
VILIGLRSIPGDSMSMMNSDPLWRGGPVREDPHQRENRLTIHVFWPLSTQPVRLHCAVQEARRPASGQKPWPDSPAERRATWRRFCSSVPRRKPPEHVQTDDRDEFGAPKRESRSTTTACCRPPLPNPPAADDPAS